MKKSVQGLTHSLRYTIKAALVQQSGADKAKDFRPKTELVLAWGAKAQVKIESLHLYEKRSGDVVLHIVIVRFSAEHPTQGRIPFPMNLEALAEDSLQVIWDNIKNLEGFNYADRTA